MGYYLGVDGGGSKTLAIVSDGMGRILGRGRSGCGNHQVGAALADRNIRKAAEDALAEAGIGKEEINFALFGLAGADREADFRILRPMIASMGFAKTDIVCDTVIGMRAGTKQSDGVVLICGSGTNCYGMNSRGDELQVGGFGYAYGDFGGGNELAVEVFRSVIRSWEGREAETALTQLTLEALGYPDVERMFHGTLDECGRPPHTLAKLLFEASPTDAVAREILQRQGTELGKAASAVIRKLGMEEDAFDVVLAGSVLSRGKGDFVVPFVEREVKAAAPRARMRVLELEPAAGALLLAMERDGLIVEAEVYEQLEQSLSVKARDIEWAMD
ncbi:BadF/BadG/BcrA/BcrD ATPase family protein [Paenibacillus sp. LHD-117]|uniref:N-acetylglucosamine kinase n=1 Tax=Paenibacillus sp. LHD-117 TaxID=3071412 RepID=UPI0027E064AE|nr:BadF/BadG/BcrA/BcrD ATPase family protein [Paenibacillus sp. LHD-117]MDQ6419318.1 BadF/BadG/BcrA/BcrD ATPase family protein [Paenibacillus sp. LHD-117]